MNEQALQNFFDKADDVLDDWQGSEDSMSTVPEFIQDSLTFVVDSSRVVRVRRKTPPGGEFLRHDVQHVLWLELEPR